MYKNDKKTPFLLAALLLLQGCATISDFFQDEDQEVARSARSFSKQTFVEPSASEPPHWLEMKGEGVYKVGKPYKINGVWYFPKEDMQYDEIGLASWYGIEEHQKNTANGEFMDKNLLTAAHKTLPLPSIVKVTNLKNGRSLLVRVNDRGPFVNDRIIDLSHKAAELLGILDTGLAKVRVELMPEESMTVANRAQNITTLNQLPAGQVRQRAQVKAGAVRVYNEDSIPSEPEGDYLEPPVRRSFHPEHVSVGTRLESQDSYQTSPKLATAEELNLEGLAEELKRGEGLKGMSADTTAEEGYKIVPEKRHAVKKENTKVKIKEALPAHLKVISKENKISSQAEASIQVGAYGSQSAAQDVVKSLEGVGSVRIVPVRVNGRNIYRVRVGPFKDMSEASQVEKEILARGFQGVRLLMD